MYNSLEVLGCSSNCLCFRQVAAETADVNCDTSKAVGGGVKMACFDKCLQDCNGNNCGESMEKDSSITRLQLTGDGQICTDPVADKDFVCETENMIKDAEGNLVDDFTRDASAVDWEAVAMWGFLPELEEAGSASVEEGTKPAEAAKTDNSFDSPLLPNDLIEVSFSPPGTDPEECVAPKQIATFDLCCSCMQTANPSGTPTGLSNFTIKEDGARFEWISFPNDVSCGTIGGPLSLNFATADCMEQTDGVPYLTKITSVTRREKTCAELKDANLLQCGEDYGEEGPGKEGEENGIARGSMTLLVLILTAAVILVVAE